MTATPASFVIPSAAYRRERWRNLLGWTREIVRHPDSDAWAWRISIAEIERDARFSTFPGIERELVLLSGNGLRLRFVDGDVHELRAPHDRVRFDGARSVRGELLDGPTLDFNLMWRRESTDAELWHRPLAGSMVLFVEPHTTWVVHLLAGNARFADDSGLASLEAGDTAVLHAGGNRGRHVLDGGGEVVLIRLWPRDGRA